MSPRRQLGIRNALALTLLATLAGCAGSGSSYRATLNLTPGRYYPPPGPPSDPWGPYIREAAARFSVPQQWIRAVMRQESAGAADALSPAGAIGLMQVMPATYAGLQYRYDLGNDPWEPHDNIMAGTAYIKEMYDRFGSPGFLAAYNAGPGRMDNYLSTGNPLPTETVHYVASIAPRLGGPAPTALPTYAFARQPTPGTCDPDAAYDPSRPCAPAVIYASATTPMVPPQPDAAKLRPRRGLRPHPPVHPAARRPCLGCSPPPQYPPSMLYHPAPPPRVQYPAFPSSPRPRSRAAPRGKLGGAGRRLRHPRHREHRGRRRPQRGPDPPCRRPHRRLHDRAFRQCGALSRAADQPFRRPGRPCLLRSRHGTLSLSSYPAQRGLNRPWAFHRTRRWLSYGGMDA